MHLHVRHQLTPPPLPLNTLPVGPPFTLPPHLHVCYLLLYPPQLQPPPRRLRHERRVGGGLLTHLTVSLAQAVGQGVGLFGQPVAGELRDAWGDSRTGVRGHVSERQTGFMDSLVKQGTGLEIQPLPLASSSI